MKKIKCIRAVFEDDCSSKGDNNKSGYPVVIVTGTPGTGKSTVINSLSSKARVLNISDLVKKKGLHDGYDSEYDTYIVNDRKTRKELRKTIPEMRQKGPVVIECHSLGLFDEDDLEEMIDGVLVLTCSTESLYDRLQARGYSPKKIEENMECEIMRVCADEATEVFRSDGVVKEMANDTEKDQKLVISKLKKMLSKS